MPNGEVTFDEFLLFSNNKRNDLLARFLSTLVLARLELKQVEREKMRDIAERAESELPEDMWPARWRQDVFGMMVNNLKRKDRIIWSLLLLDLAQIGEYQLMFSAWMLSPFYIADSAVLCLTNDAQSEIDLWMHANDDGTMFSLGDQLIALGQAKNREDFFVVNKPLLLIVSRDQSLTPENRWTLIDVIQG